MAAAFRYRVVDVFTRHALEGNPLAVFPEAAQLEERTMQKIAQELNLSETVFVLPSAQRDCAARIRIFTPVRELIFAGHPTLGAAFVLLQEGRVAAGADQFLLEEKVGPVAVRVERGQRPLLWLRTPRIEFGATLDPALCAKIAGLSESDLLPVPPQRVSAGNPCIFIPLKNREAVDRVSLEMQGLRAMKAGDDEPVCIFVFAPTPEGAYSRMFAPELGVVEDPATGSATGPLAAYMVRYGLVAPGLGSRFISEQGTKMGRRSILHINVLSAEIIEVGGYVTPLVNAVMELPANNPDPA